MCIVSALNGWQRTQRTQAEILVRDEIDGFCDSAIYVDILAWPFQFYGLASSSSGLETLAWTGILYQ